MPDGSPATPATIAVVGEALVDLVPTGPDGLFAAVPGGSPANVAIGLARLGIPVRLVARLSEDHFGGMLRGHLADNGVDLTFARAAEEHSSLAIVAVDSAGRVEYDFRVDGTADWQWQESELLSVVDDRVAAVHSGSLALTMPPGDELLLGLLGRARRLATISYDPNCRPGLMGAPEEMRLRVERLLALADVVKVSDEDLAWLHPGQDSVGVARAWLSAGPALVVVTLGAEGAVGVSADGEVRRPGIPVEVIDAVGAGDAFTSALLAGLHSRGLLGAARRDSLRSLGATGLGDVLGEAVLASALTCARRGAEPPTVHELASAAQKISAHQGSTAVLKSASARFAAPSVSSSAREPRTRSPNVNPPR